MAVALWNWVKQGNNYFYQRRTLIHYSGLCLKHFSILEENWHFKCWNGSWCTALVPHCFSTVVLDEYALMSSLPYPFLLTGCAALGKHSALRASPYSVKMLKERQRYSLYNHMYAGPGACSLWLGNINSSMLFKILQSRF